MAYSLRSNKPLPDEATLGDDEVNVRKDTRNTFETGDDRSEIVNYNEYLISMMANLEVQMNEIKAQLLFNTQSQNEILCNEQTTNAAVENSRQGKVVAMTEMKAPVFEEKYNKPSEWLQDFENIASINEWSDNQKISFVSLSLVGKSKRWYNTLVEKPNWSDFKQLFIDRYETKNNSETLRKLRSIKKFDNESLQDYLDRCLELFHRVDGELSDIVKCDYVSAGLNYQLQTKMIDKKIKFANLRKFFAEQQQIENIRSDRFDGKTECSSNVREKINQSDVECFNCGKKGHYKNNCKENRNNSENVKGASVRQEVPK